MIGAKEVIQNDLDYMLRLTEPELACLAGDRVLITGGAGFLGYYLIQLLLAWNVIHPERPIEVILCDNFLRGEPAWVTQLKGNPHCQVLTWDVRQPWPTNLPPCPWVIHGASVASPIYYRKWPIETIEANVIGLLTLLHRCLKYKATGGDVKGVLFFSSSEIYGDPNPEQIPTSEAYNGNVSCAGPRACYDESKRLGEAICTSFVHQHGLRVVSVRPFNNFGPGLKITDRRVLPDFARNIFNGEDIILLSDGSPTRTFCYIADAVIGYVKTLVRGVAGEAYNIGVEAPEISISDLAQKVVALGTELFNYGGKVKWEKDPDANYLIDSPNRRCPSINKAKTALGYEPQISLDEGLRRTMIWYAENQGGTDA